MNARGFTSALAPELDAYLTFKEKMGCYGNSRIWYLRQFDAYCTAHERTVFDRDTVEGWVSERLAETPEADFVGPFEADDRQDAEADAIGTDAVLDPSAELAFDPDQERSQAERAEQRDTEGEDFRDQEGGHGGGSLRGPRVYLVGAAPVAGAAGGPHLGTGPPATARSRTNDGCGSKRSLLYWHGYRPG